MHFDLKKEFIHKRHLDHVVIRGQDCEGLPWDYYAFEFPRSQFQDVLALHWQDNDVEGYVIDKKKRETLYRCLTSLPSPTDIITLTKIADFVFQITDEGSTLLILSRKLTLKDFLPVVKDRTIRKTLQNWPS